MTSSCGCAARGSNILDVELDLETRFVRLAEPRTFTGEPCNLRIYIMLSFMYWQLLGDVCFWKQTS